MHELIPGTRTNHPVRFSRRARESREQKSTVEYQSKKVPQVDGSLELHVDECESTNSGISTCHSGDKKGGNTVSQTIASQPKFISRRCVVEVCSACSTADRKFTLTIRACHGQINWQSSGLEPGSRFLF